MPEIQAQRKRSKSTGNPIIDIAALKDMAAKHKERKRSTGNTFDMSSLKESLAIAEMKAAAASQKIKEVVIRKVSQGQDQPYVPPKQLLLYLVRMGSFTSIPKVKGSDNQDGDITFEDTSVEVFLNRCRAELGDLPRPFKRNLKIIHKDLIGSDENIRVLQWNQLSQTLGTKNDKFVKCSPAALDWSTRRWRLLEEIVRYDPDVICLQEVDHLSLFTRALSSIGYNGHFVPKPDSPCIYLPDNNGPDGCAIFYKKDKFEMLAEPASRVVEVWRVQSNQVVLSINLRHKKTGKDICVATTHLKARSGALLSTLRNEQGKDILEWIEEIKPVNQPLILCGDFNAEPSEPVYRTMTENTKIPLNPAYKISESSITGEPNTEESEDLTFTTWKIRETGEQKHILDYIFHSSDTLRTVATLDMPDEDQIGEDRLPSLAFASDHLSLLADLRFSTD